MTRAELATKLEAKANASHDTLRLLIEQLAELPGALTVASDGRELLSLISDQEREVHHLALLASAERYWANKEAEPKTLAS
jgi:hypothetical protein